MIVPTMTAARTARVWAPSSQSARYFPHRLRRGVETLGRTLGCLVDSTPLERSFPTSFHALRELAAVAETSFRAPHIGALMATSGGWTSLALLPHLDMNLIAAHPTALVGQSDLTVLLNAITAATNMITYLGPMILPSLAEHGGAWPITATSLRRALFAKPSASWTLEHGHTWTDEHLPWESHDTRPRHGQTHPDPLRVLRPGRGAGRLWGGSMRSLRLLAGTPYWPTPNGPTVLTLEDERLSPDELFALVTSLDWAGAFDNCTGVLVGRHSMPHPNSTGYDDLDAALLEAVPHRIPVVAGLDIGHTEPVHTLPLGAQVIVDAREPSIDPTIAITLEDACHNR